MLGDSIHSERSGLPKHSFRSRESRPPLSDSRSRSRMPSSSIPPSLQITSTVEDFDPSARGRSLRRADFSPLDPQGEHDWFRSEDGSQRRWNSRATRRGASMIFMGAWVLFGIGTLGMRGFDAESGVAIQPGRVISSPGTPTPILSFPSPAQESAPLAPVDLVFEALQGEGVSKDGRPVAGPPLERVVGRISAWACTTLYLTSRLPQIWKNVRF
jgi:solute carrier family 66 (lysosomal lysine-arginine transporter), member 1